MNLPCSPPLRIITSIDINVSCPLLPWDFNDGHPIFLKYVLGTIKPNIELAWIGGLTLLPILVVEFVNKR
jgi:hypothetical protein